MTPEMKDKLRQLITGRQQCYKQTFRGPVGEVVLRDLARFCRANKSAFHENQRATDIALGRQEVWLRLQQHLQLSPTELWRLTSGED